MPVIMVHVGGWKIISSVTVSVFCIYFYFYFYLYKTYCSSSLNALESTTKLFKDLGSRNAHECVVSAHLMHIGISGHSGLRNLIEARWIHQLSF